MTKTIHESIYARIQQVVPGIHEMPVGTALKLKASGFMDLSVEVLRREDRGRTIIAMAHYGEQNGDLMADPDMEIAIIPSLKMAEAMTFQNDYVGVFQRVYPDAGKVNVKLKRDLNDFLLTWLGNILDQGHRLAEQEAA